MDYWNNAAGRQIGLEASSVDEIGLKVYQAIQNGGLITDLGDTRQWEEPGLYETLDDVLNNTSNLQWINQLFDGGMSADEISDLEDSFTLAASATAPRRYDPLTLDLDGDGLETTVINGGTFFNQDANGFAEQTGWVGKDDGLLVWDRNGDGQVNDGRELFGDRAELQDGTIAANGFAALAEWDDSADGKIDVNDSVWSDLRIWRDADSDGLSTADELHTLDSLSVAAINLAYANTGTADGQGNIQTRLGSFTKSDGSTGNVGEYQFNRDATYSIATEFLDVTPDIATLPSRIIPRN